ncbi:MAG: hypothetical protein ACTHN5_01455 [Phycisphaerae bacterium]
MRRAWMGRGGRVEMMGAKVGVYGTVDASGAAGGGDVRIGGDWHGKGELPRSEKTVVTGAVKADATGTGNGGTVVVWSEGETVFAGSISAKGAGGGAGGGGGSAEVSSHGVLNFNPVTVDMGGGQLLLDPISITIQDANPDINGNGTTGDDINNANDLDAVSKQNGRNSIITSGALNGLMSGGGASDVTLAASSFITIGTSGTHINTGTKTLTLDAPTINLGDVFTGTITPGGTVTAVHVTNTAAKIQDGVNLATTAGAVLTINAGTYTGAVSVTGNLTMNANGTVIADSWTTSGAGKTVTMSGTFQSAGNISLGSNSTLGGTTVLNGGNIGISAPVTGNNNTLQLISTGDESITTTITLGTGVFSCAGANFSLSSGVIGANNITLTQSGNINLTGNLTAGSGASGFVTLASGGGIVTAGISGTNVSVTSNAGASGAVTLGNISASTALVVSADGDISQTASTTISSGGASLVSANGNVTLGGASASASGGNMSLGAGLAISGANVTAGNLTGTAGTTLNLTGGQVNTFTGTSHGAMTFVNGGGLTVKGANSNGNDITLSDSTGALSVTGNVTAGAGNVSLTGHTDLTNSATVSGANVTLAATTGSILGTGNVTAGAGDATLTAATNITTTAGTISGTNVVLTATGGAISGGANITATGNANLTAGGDISAAGGSLSGGAVNVTSTGGNVTISENYTATGAGNVTVTANGDVTMGSFTISGGNVTLTATNGSMTGSGTVTATGLANLTAAANLIVSGGSVTGGVVTATGGTLIMDEDFTATAGNATLSGSLNVWDHAGGVVSGNNVSITSANGGIGQGGLPVKVSTAGNVTLVTGGAGGAGDIVVSTGGALDLGTVAVTTDAGSGQLVSLTAGGALTVSGAFGTAADDLSLTGTTVAVNAGLTGGTVGLTSTTGGISGTGGVTATTLNLSAATTINLTGNGVGTLNGTANGTVTFGNAGGFAAGNVTSNGNDLSLRDTTGAVSVSGAVTAGTANATVRAATNITNGGGTVTGGIVTLTADTGNIGASGSSVQTVSGSATADLVLSAAGGNIFVTDAHGIDTTNVAVTLGSGKTLSLAAPTIALTNSLVNDAGATVVLTSTTGGITGTTGSINAANVSLVSAAGINVANVTAGSNLSLTGSGADITLANATGTLDLGIVHVTDTAGQTVTLTAPVFGMTGNFSAAGDVLVLNAITPGGTTTIAHNITAQSITLSADDLTVTGGALLADGTSGTLQIKPFTNGRGINLSGSVVGGALNIDPALLAGSTAHTVVLGGSGVIGGITVGTADLHLAAYDLTLQTSGGVTFTGGGTLTLANDRTLTFDGVGGVVNGTSGPAVVIGGTNGTVAFTNVAGDIGTHANPLTTQVSFLDGVSGVGTVYVSNTGGLTVNGVVNPTGGNGDGFIETHSPLTVSADIAVAGNFTLTANNGDLTVDNGATVSSTTSGEIDLVTGTVGDMVLNNGNVFTAGGTAKLEAAGNLTLTSANVTVGSGTANLTAAGNLTLNSSTVSATGGAVKLDSAENVTLNTSSVLTGNGNITLLGEGGVVTMNGTNSSLTAGLLDAESVSGTALDSNSITVGTLRAVVSPGAGDLVFKDQTGVVIDGITIGAGNATIVAGGNVTQGITQIFVAGGNLTVQTRSAGGASILLTKPSNDLGTGLAMLQVQDAGGGNTVSADVQFRTTGEMHVQQVDAGTGGNVTLTAGTTMDQVLADGVGIRGAGLTVNSAGDVALTNTNNAFATLTVADTNGSASHLAFVTNAAGGLTVAGFSQTTTGGGATASIVNQTGAISSGVALTTGNLSLTATGGVSLSNTSNSIPAITVTNNVSGVINILDASALTILGSTQNAGFATTFTGSNDITVAGNVIGGNGTSLTTGSGHTLATAGANITDGSFITLKADGWVLDPAQTITAPAVTLTSATPTHAILLDGSVGAGLSNGELDSIHTASLVIGDSGLTAGITSGTTAVSFGANATGNITLVSAGGISLASANFAENGSAAVSMQHTGVLTLANGTFGGTFVESAVGGTGAGGTAQLSGLIQTTNKTVTFNSQVQLAGTGASVSTVGTTGANITFGFSGGASVIGTTAGGQNLTLTAGTSTILFGGAVGTAGVPLGAVTVNSVGTLNLPTVFATGENITHNGVLTVSGVQTLGSGGFVEGGTGSVALGANVVSTGGANVFGSAVALGTSVSISGTTTTFNGTLTGNGHDLTVNGNGVFAAVGGVGTVHVTGNGTFGGTLNGGAATVDGNGSFAGVALTGALQTGGAAAFNGGVNAATVSVGGLATVATPTITTSGIQTYSGGMSLSNDAGLSGTTVTIGNTLTGNGHSLTIGQDAVLGMVSGTGGLHVLRDATLGGTVNTGTLQVDGNEIVNTGSVTSSGSQTVIGVTVLGTSTTLAGSSVTLAGGVSGNGRDLTVAGSGVFGAIDGAGAIHVTSAAQFNGAVTSSGSVLVDGSAVIATNAITTSGTQTYSGTTTLGAGTTLTGSTVTFGNALAGGGFDLTVGGNGVFAGVSNIGALHVTGGATFGGAVSANSLVVDGASAINTGVITTTGTQTYNGAATLGTTATLTGSTVTFGNSLIGDGHDLTVSGNGVFNLVSGVGTLHDTGAATFDGAVSAGNVTVDGAAAINSANITTTGTQIYSGAATLGTTTSLTAATVTFGNTLTGNSHGLTVHGNGVFATLAGLGDLHVTGTAGFGGTVTANSVLVDGSSVINTGNITTVGAQTYTGGATLGTNATPAMLTGTTITFGGALAGGGNSLSVIGNGVFAQISNVGSLIVTKAATFDGTVSGGILAVGGVATINSANITTTSSQTFTGGASFGSNSSLTGSQVTFTGTLTGNSHDVTVHGNGVFGTVAGIHNLTVNGAGAFNKNVNGSGLLKVTGAGTFNGTVAVGSLNVGGAASLVQNVTTSGDQTYGGKLTVNLSHDVVLQTTGHVPAGSTGSILINGGLDGTGGGTLTLQTAKQGNGVIANDTDHAMKIAGNVSMGGATLNIVNGGAVQFAPLGGTSQTVNAGKVSFALPDGQKAPDQVLATIYSKGGDLTFNTGAGGFFMGHGEALTVFNPNGGGNLKIVSPTGNITLGDLTVLGDIDVDSGGRPIAFQAHGNISLPNNLNSPNKFTQTTGVVAGGNVTMNGQLTIPHENVPNPLPLNFKNEVWFSVKNPGMLHLTGTQVAQGANGTQASAQFFSFSQVTTLAPNQLDVNGVVVYAPADGSAPAFALQSSVPRDVQTLQPERAATVAGTMLEDLQHLGVNARPANKDELLAYLLGNAIYNDIPMTLTPAYKDMRVAANRLPNEPILPTVSVYRKLFFEPVVDANGQVVKDKDGNPQMRRRSDKIQGAFELAWDAYMADQPKGTPEGLRAYLESKKSDAQMATALDYLNQMRELLVQIRSLGLTDTEFNLSKGVLFREVQPQNIASSDAFLSAIMGVTQSAKQNEAGSPRAEAAEENSLKNVTAMR